MKEESKKQGGCVSPSCIFFVSPCFAKLQQILVEIRKILNEEEKEEDKKKTKVTVEGGPFWPDKVLFIFGARRSRYTPSFTQVIHTIQVGRKRHNSMSCTYQGGRRKKDKKKDIQEQNSKINACC